MLQSRNNKLLRIIATGFFLLAAAPLFFSSLFLLKQHAARQKIKEKLETGALQTLILPEKDLLWVRKDKEIRVGGELFDVKSIIKQNDKVIVTGLFDDEETEIEQLLGHLSGSRSIITHMLLNLFSFLHHIFPGSLGFELLNTIFLPMQYFIDFIPFLPELPHCVITPPPQKEIFF